MPFSDELEDRVANKIVENEYNIAKLNKVDENTEFEGYVDLLDSVREPKDYDWMSDIRLPEFVSHVLTQSSIDANQYFKSRDFVEVYLEDESDEAREAAEANKELINRTLNQRHLHHYLKYLRGKVINNLSGRVFARCWWEQKTAKAVTGVEKTFEPLDVDINGAPIFSEEQTRAFTEVETPIEEDVPLIDRFNYDVMDSRNVFMDNTYTYSIQDKDWITIRSEKSTDEIEKEADLMGYFNLEKLRKDFKTDTETKTSEETYNNGQVKPSQIKNDNATIKVFDVIERFGSFWCIINERDETGYPIDISPGLDENGEKADGAELLETIITFAISGSNSILIRFQPTPYIDSQGVPFKPIIRGLCYVHPTHDGGMGDGQNVRELQLALDDTFNLSNDRTMFATMPTLLVQKDEADDNPDIFLEPGHKIPLTNVQDDLQELKIEDNIQGSIQQMATIRGMMQQVDAVYPTTMGDTPQVASTTATAVAGAEQRTDARSNYKSLTFENTFLNELYWMVTQMTWSFAFPQTGEKLMGQKVMNFNPEKDFFYQPLSQSIETEYSKQTKIQNYTQILGQVVQIGHPDTVKIVNLVLQRIFENMGDEYVNFGNKLLNPEKPIEDGSETPPGAEGVPVSNQEGIPQGTTEQVARDNSGR